MPTLTNEMKFKAKLIGGSIVVLLLAGGGFFCGSKWTSGKASKEITEHVTLANNEQVQGQQAVDIAVSQNPVIERLTQAIVDQQVLLDRLQSNMTMNDRKFQGLLNSSATDKEKLAGAIEVIKEKDEYIQQYKKLLVNKDEIIDATTKKAEGYKEAYDHEVNANKELRTALSAATTNKFRKYNFSGSYTPVNGDWGLSADRNFEHLPVSVGLGCDRVTLTQDTKEFRVKIRLGFNM